MEHAEFKSKINPVLPKSAGVYRFIDGEGKVLYVGKAKILKSRVNSYFNKSSQHSNRIKMLVKKARNIEFTIVENEHDALLLENSLIKKFQPRYNVMLKDDKTYPFICIKNEPFPRVFLTRKRIKDGSQYLGPFTSVTRVKLILDFINLMYPIRTCNFNLTDKNIKAGKFKVCLEYHLGNCLGPCEGLQSKQDYDDSIEQIKHIINGKGKIVINHLKKQMLYHAGNFEFEEAENLKKKIEHLKNYQSKSTIVNPKIDNVDVLGIDVIEERAFVNYFKVVNGSIIQTYAMQIKKQLDETPAELLIYALIELRNKFGSSSSEVIVPFNIEYPSDEIHFTVPQRGDKLKLLELARKNALQYKIRVLTKYDRKSIQKGHVERILGTLKSDFRMKDTPYHIECFDNSNFQGTDPVASAVVFKNAKPSKKDYRHFHIKTVKGPDDFASMSEVVLRRYKRLLSEKSPLPQLIIVDGGKGQLSAAVKSLKQLGIDNQVVVAGIAKRLEEIYFPNDPLPLYINKKSESLKLLQQLRNEAHRFAITFHRQSRQKNTLKTQLTDIQGIGNKTSAKLLKKFKSVKKIRNASIDELKEVVGPKNAGALVEHFKQNPPK